VFVFLAKYFIPAKHEYNAVEKKKFAKDREIQLKNMCISCRIMWKLIRLRRQVEQIMQLRLRLLSFGLYEVLQNLNINTIIAAWATKQCSSASDSATQRAN
jgi:hypothetical protein